MAKELQNSLHNSSDRRYRLLVVAINPVQYMAPLLRRLAIHPRIDLKVAYCTMRGAEPGIDPEFGTTIHWDVPLLDGYNWERLENKGTDKPGFLEFCNWGLWRLIRNGKYDAIILYTGYRCASFWISIVGARLAGSAILFGTDASSLSPRDSRGWKVAVKKIFWPWLFGLADQVIAPSTPTKRMIRSLGIKESQVSLTPYVVDNDWWRAAAARVDRSEVRTSWGANEQTLVILFCAKLQPWKRPGDLLKAFAKLGKVDALLLFAGDGALKQRLIREGQTLGVSERVHFLGFLNQSQLPAVYRSADIMVLPSEYEPFGVVVNEAYCCGCAVAVSDRVGSGQDLVSAVDESMIFPCGDIDAIARIFHRCLYERTILSAISSKARLRLDKWSPEANIDGTVAAIERAVEHRKP